jgi:hypothetical protein
LKSIKLLGTVMGGKPFPASADRWIAPGSSIVEATPRSR